MYGLLTEIIIVDNAGEGLDSVDLGGGCLAGALACFADEQLHQGRDPISCPDLGQQRCCI